MKNIIFLCILSLLTLLPSMCKKKSDECVCRDLENCVDGKCVLKENCYYLNNQAIEGFNLYHGVVKNNICVDTLVLDVRLYDPSPAYKFILYANVSPWGRRNVEPRMNLKVSDSEYVLGSLTTICHQNGKEWYASYIHCKIAKDSVLMDIQFRERYDPTDRVVDSCKVTLYK